MKNLITNNKIFRSLTLASLLLMSAFSAQAGLILSFDESDIAVELNDNFTLSLYADTEYLVDWFTTFSIDTSFDSSILSLDSVTLGDFDGTLDSAFYADPVLFSPIADPVLFSPIIGGSGVFLASLSFTAIGLGDTTLNTINAVFSNIFSPAAAISVDLASANISVADSSAVAVPEPATLGFFIIGALALFGLRRKV
jgi:hypothetical protein